MSLPAGILNRPPVVAPRPAVVARVLAFAGWLGFLLLPVLLLVALQVPAVVARWRMTRLDGELAREGRRTLLLEAERARLLDPRRLRREGRRLGLVPPGPAEIPTRLRRGKR